VGSRLDIDKAYIAGFLDGDGSIMLQLKKRKDTKRGYRFMATICLYQDSRHELPLFWMRECLGCGYITKRNDAMTELRINGFLTIASILKDLEPYIRFKTVQVSAMIKACSLLSNKNLSDEQLNKIVDLIIIIQNANYKAAHKKEKVEFLSILNLTP
jgi:hypothetical protein